jgi:hypothetical protein
MGGESKKKQQSSVLDLLDQVWNHWGQATRHSWDRVNNSMRATLTLAIGSGMEFGPDDFHEIEKRYRFHFWGYHQSGGFAEGWYTRAVTDGNLSAARAFENWKGRKPFILDNIMPDRNSQYLRRVGLRQRGRVAVGYQFGRQGKLGTVTSFTENGASLTACSYKPDPEGGYRREIDKRYTITQADVRAHRNALKQSA